MSCVRPGGKGERAAELRSRKVSPTGRAARPRSFSTGVVGLGLACRRSSNGNVRLDFGEG